MKIKITPRDRYKRKNGTGDPIFSDVEWIVTGRYTLITSRASVPSVRMRAFVSNSFSIHVSEEYLRKHFIRIPEKCYSWKDGRRCQKLPDHKGAHRYEGRSR